MRFRHTCKAILALLCVSTPGFSQVVTATLTGSVRDATGAYVAGARIRAINVATNLDRETVSDSAGVYSLTALSPGEYRLESEHPGFKKTVLSGIVLQVNQQARVDVALQLGQVSESVSVEASAPLVETETPVVGGVINETRIVGLPLNGRNFMELTTLTGGMNEGQGSNAKGGILNKGFAPSAAGMPATDNNYQLDGADNKEAFFNTFNLAPSVDAVQEFRIQVGQYSAEFGSGGGAVINVVTKSGTNSFHGAAWEFVRNDFFDARNFFLRPDQNIASLRQNQFGVAAGGPVVKNRTFIFGNFDLTRVRRGSFRTAYVPTDALKAGNFSAVATPIIDPLTGTQFPGNIIPASRISPISANILKYYPALNNPSNPAQNYINNLPSQDDVDNYLVRADHRLSDKHDLMGRYGSQEVNRFTPGTYALVGGQLQPQRFQGAVLGLTSTFTPTLLNQARFSYNRAINRTQGQNSGDPIAAQIGIPFAPSGGLSAGFPEAISLQRTLVSSISEGQPWFLTVNSFQWYDGVTWIKGAHTLKAGADIRRSRSDANLFTRQNNAYTFSGQFTGDGFADFLLGFPSSSSLALKENDPARFRRTQQAYYLTDDWKATSNLTLTIGLRYELNAIPKELSGLTPKFDPTLGGGRGGLLFPKQNTTALPWFQANRPDLPVGVLDRETLFNNDTNNFAPRFGFAWRPLGNNNTVVRGGYGIYYSSAQINNLVQNSVTGPPAQMWPSYSSDPRTPTLNYAGQIGTPPEQALRSATFGVLTGPEDNFLDGYTQQWSLSLGRTIGQSFVVEAQYLGSKGTHLENLLDYNAAPTAGSGALTQRVPFPAWGRVAGFSSGAAANYNALMLTAEKRLSHGLQFKASYTFSKNLTKNGGRMAAGNTANVQNPYDLRNESGYSIDHVPHRFIANYVYQLPFGSGMAIGNNLGGFANRLIGGWTVAGITTIRSGFYLRPVVGAQNCNNGYFIFCRPDLLRNPWLGGDGVHSPRWDRNAFDYPFNTAAHPAQTPRFGTAGLNILQGNGLINFDMSLQKAIPINERLRMEFRFESFNAFNHTNFGDPNPNVDNPNFGLVFSSASPRVNQLGLKMYW